VKRVSSYKERARTGQASAGCIFSKNSEEGAKKAATGEPKKGHAIGKLGGNYLQRGKLAFPLEIFDHGKSARSKATSKLNENEGKVVGGGKKRK